MERYDLDSEDGNLPRMSISPEQLQALMHALKEPVVSMMLAEDADLPNKGAMGFLIEAYDSEGWLLVGYPWNKDGMPTWLAADGGWHFQPNETGYYPWREDA